MPAYQFVVSVIKTEYLEEESDASEAKYVFAYTIRITNEGETAAQLISRHWLITDGKNYAEQVHGLGVVGKQPLLKGGEHFEYTSGASLATPYGSMKGKYFFVTEDGQPFEIGIPEFVLSLPNSLH